MVANIRVANSEEAGMVDIITRAIQPAYLMQGSIQ
jgi:hypothetical protein